MHRHLNSQICKALLLGFFCCLGVSAQDLAKKDNKVIPFALKQVHPDSGALVDAIAKGTQMTPPGYQIYPMRITDPETHKLIGHETILLSRKTIVGLDAIELARPSGDLGVLSVLLTPEGGKRLTNATQNMQLGVSRMAVVIEGKCFIAPTVQAVLSRDFVISGLTGKAEVERLAKFLSPKAHKANK